MRRERRTPSFAIDIANPSAKFSNLQLDMAAALYTYLRRGSSTTNKPAVEQIYDADGNRSHIFSPSAPVRCLRGGHRISPPLRISVEMRAEQRNQIGSYTRAVQSN